MKNIPHQINDLAKLTDAIRVFANLEDSGVSLSDDRSVGVEMARAGVYAFRNKELSIEDSLLVEALKSKNSQGTRTVARDLRRLFLLLGFLQVLPSRVIALTRMGRALCELGHERSDAQDIWREALRGLVLKDESGTEVHPYLALLRLVGLRPGIEIGRLAVVLEATNDSALEFDRILGIADRSDWFDKLLSSGSSEHMIRNAIKILPALGRQLGDISEINGKVSIPENPSGMPGRFRERPTRQRTPVQTGGSPGSEHRKVTAHSIAQIPQASGRFPDEEDYASAALSAEKRLARLQRHNEIVRWFASRLEGAGYGLREDPYDTLGTREAKPAVLVEVKTLDGSAPDEVARVRGALAQLLYYSHFDVNEPEKSAGLLPLALFESRISEEHIAFLECQGIAVAWMDGDTIACNGWSAKRLSEIGVM